MQALGNYQEARKNYTIYLEGHPQSELAQKGLLATIEVPVWKKTPTRYVIKPADVLNSRRNSDFAPAFMGTDAQSIVITSNRGTTSTKGKNSSITGVPNNDLFVARKNAMNKWEELSPLEGEFNTEDDEGAASFSSDGNTLFYPLPFDRRAVGAEIYSSQRSADNGQRRKHSIISR